MSQIEKLETKRKVIRSNLTKSITKIENEKFLVEPSDETTENRVDSGGAVNSFGYINNDGEMRICFVMSKGRTQRCVLSLSLVGDLPVSRVNPVRAFSKSRVDFAGPFQVKPRRGRDVRALKTYECIFVCFITKAVHLELVGDLTAKSFIAVLKRFIARRGRHEELYSDCGTNFIGACRVLRKWASNEVMN
ncbi:uncharacterized protein TNCV_493241 [Trichonephila clavipes]|nr:uncharacterized protein TNCV_493241 [Trichonephila clavipes]